MRPSILRFRKLPYSNGTLISKITILITCAVLMGSCRVRENSLNPPTAEVNDVFARLTEPILANDLILKVANPNNQDLVEVARMEASGCSIKPDAPGNELWNLTFSSPFGKHQVTIDYKGYAPGKLVNATVDGAAFGASIPPPWNTQQLISACESAKNSRGHLEITSEMAEPVKGLLATLAPQCAFTLGPEGWQCRIQAKPLTEINHQIEEIRRSMIQKWSRHPYILTRRITLAAAIADALSSEEKLKSNAMARVCKIMGNQLPSELPLSFRSPSTGKIICNPEHQDRFMVAQIALNDALLEINKLKEKLEKSSHLGTLVVRIPHNEVRGRELWISLSPLGTDGVEAANLAKLDIPPTSCWEPIYSANEGLVEVALELGLMEAARAANCTRLNPQPKHPALTLDNYILNSITSETEFAVSNGTPKILRLPRGEYQYTIRVPSEKIVEGQAEESDTPRSTGVISWKNKRPAATIIQW